MPQVLGCKPPLILEEMRSLRTVLASTRYRDGAKQYRADPAEILPPADYGTNGRFTYG